MSYHKQEKDYEEDDDSLYANTPMLARPMHEMSDMETPSKKIKIKREGKYYIIDMANIKRYFNTMKEAREYQKFIAEKTAIVLQIYSRKGRLKEVV